MQLKSAGQSAQWTLDALAKDKGFLRNGDPYHVQTGTITYNTGATTCTNTLRGILGGTQAELTQ